MTASTEPGRLPKPEDGPCSANCRQPSNLIDAGQCTSGRTDGSFGDIVDIIIKLLGFFLGEHSRAVWPWPSTWTLAIVPSFPLRSSICAMLSRLIAQSPILTTCLGRSSASWACDVGSQITAWLNEQPPRALRYAVLVSSCRPPGGPSLPCLLVPLEAVPAWSLRSNGDWRRSTGPRHDRSAHISSPSST
jgi:hypothetical protein